MAETTNTHEHANGVYGVLTAGNCKPILFSTPMVQAILRGEKTQTRRIVKYSKKITDPKIGFSAFTSNDQFEVRGVHENGQYGGSFFKLKYKVGDVLWVRETWQERSEKAIKMGFEKYYHKADWNGCTEAGWKPSIFMPKAACRIFLEVTKIRIERLQDISDDDCISEGIHIKYWGGDKTQPYAYRKTDPGKTTTDYRRYPKEAYMDLWVQINGQQNWDQNPYVFVYEFERTDASFACR